MKIMKHIITLLLVLFSASVLNARSVKIVFFLETNKNLLIIQTTDSKTQVMTNRQILLDGLNVSVSKNKDALQKIEDYLNEVRGATNTYTWKGKDAFNVFAIAHTYETIFVWSNYQVSRHNQNYDVNMPQDIYYFYKQD